MSTLHYNRQLQLAGGFFTLHNIEEAIGFSRFVYPPNVPFILRTPNVNAMNLAIGLITVLAWGIILWANNQSKEENRKRLLIVLVSVFLVNAFIPHILGAIILQRYFPGVITAVLLFLPYSFWLLPKLYRSYPKPYQFYTVVAWGLLLVGSIVAILQIIVHVYFQLLAT